MKPIIPPVHTDLLLAELTKDKFLRKTTNGNNEIYVFSHFNGPNLLREVGRLREEAFRDAGGGTGLETDIDDFDISENPYHQLIVWNPETREIVGGYRYIDCSKLKFGHGKEVLATEELFTFSDKFIKNYMQYTLELGRSFVQPKYQASRAGRKALFALDNLWDGLGALVGDNPHIKYLFGKVTMYTHYKQKARDLLLYFMKIFCPDHDKLIRPIVPLEPITPESEIAPLFCKGSFDENYRVLNQKIRELNENIPPLISSYMGLSATMKSFGTAINTHFGGVEETGMLITINDIYDSKKHRYISSYHK